MDDNEIKREIRNLYARVCWIGDLVNVQIRSRLCCLNHFVYVYMALLYGLHLTLALSTDWKHAMTCHYSRIHSVTGTNMLSDLGLPTFVELLNKCRLSFCNQWQLVLTLLWNTWLMLLVTSLVTDAVQYVFLICVLCVSFPISLLVVCSYRPYCVK